MNDFGYVENVSNFSATTDSWDAEFNEHLIQTPTLSEEVDPIAYWKSLPESPLRIVTIQILNVTSSAPVERDCSLCGNICTSTRVSMAPDLLTALVRAKYNIRGNLDEDCMDV